MEVRSFTDGAGRRVRREIVHHPGGVVVVPVLATGELVLIRNERIAVGERLWELPAGTLEPGEEPEACGARELQEETGYRPGRMTALGTMYTTPGFADEVLHLYVGEDLEFVGQDLDPGEEIEAVPVAPEDALAMIDDGRIRDGKTVAGILLWHRMSRRVEDGERGGATA